MNNEIELKVKSAYINKWQKGYPIIEKEALINIEALQDEGAIVSLVDERNRFIAKGYYGKQNKGYGWILSYDKNEKIDRDFFTRKLGSAIKKRQHYFQDEQTTAFRLFNGEGDGVGGVTIDYFAGYYLFNWYSEGIYRFQHDIIEALKELVEYKAIYEKKRFDAKGQYIADDDFVAGERGEFPIIVKENGVNFAVYLNDGAMVGVFLDQREVRKTIRDRYAKGKTVLNTFSYTGAFSVFAALGGAKKTTSVDLANRSLSKTSEQFRINGLDPEEEEIIVSDVFNFFKFAKKKNRIFDLVILDPPSFARSKKHTFSAAKDYPNLLQEAIAITSNGGVIVASTNSSAFGMKKFKSFIQTAFKKENCQYEIVEEFSLPDDFRTLAEYKEGNYLKVIFIKKIEKK